MLALSFYPAIFASWTDWLSTGGSVILAVCLVLVCTTAWLTNLIAAPGNWICVLLLALYAWVGPQEGRLAISYWLVLATFVIALTGEAIEFFAGAAGAKRAGASRKSTLYSIIGSVAGALAGALIGVPIPIVGPVIAAIVFGGVGASAGAMYGEWTDGREWKENWSIGHTTFWARTFGVLGKFTVGMLIPMLTLIAVLV